MIVQGYDLTAGGRLRNVIKGVALGAGGLAGAYVAEQLFPTADWLSVIIGGGGLIWGIWYIRVAFAIPLPPRNSTAGRQLSRIGWVSLAVLIGIFLLLLTLL
jgi:hypothetical protein